MEGPCQYFGGTARPELNICTGQPRLRPYGLWLCDEHYELI